MTQLDWTKPVIVPAVDVPDGVEYVEPEVRELARGVAADIRHYGHWQEGNGRDEEVCVIIAPAYKAFQHEITRRIPDDLQEVVRLNDLATRFRLLLCGTRHVSAVADWNDSTPTADVLAALDRIAEGLVES